MTTMNNSNTFIFRNKFEKFLNTENRSVITSAFEKFCSLDPETTDVLSILWRLTYNTDIITAASALKELGLNPEIIPPEMISKLRDELRHQYDKLHTGFLEASVYEECKCAFEALANKADPIVAAVVNEHCLYRMYAKDVSRPLFLLNSPKENFFFGGICDLDFRKEEAEYLKPYHMQIHDLLEANYNRHQQTVHPQTNTPLEALELPFIFEEVGEEKASKALPETLAEEPIQTTCQFRRLIAEAVIMHKDVFISFFKNDDFNVLLDIVNLGFDLNEVVAKKKKICNLLEAIEEKEKAEAKLFEAHEALNT